MKFKLMCSGLVAAVMVATAVDDLPNPDNLMQEAADSPAGKLIPISGPPRFVLTEGHLVGDGAAVVRMFRMDVKTGKVWFQSTDNATGIVFWREIMEESQAARQKAKLPPLKGK